MSDKQIDRIVAEIMAQARARKIGRRGFMEGMLATGATVTGASALWGSKVAAQTPKRGGTFRAGLHDGNTADSLDPGTTESVYMIQLNHATRSYLTEITNTNELGPDLADSWEATQDDASEWRFVLNPDATFHNGNKVTPEDVVASINFHRGEATASAAKALLTDVSDVKADGDNAVVVTMASGNADLPYLMSDYHLVILPAKPDGGIDWESGVGSGPYKIVNHEPGVRSELERHDGWHREGAWFDGVSMLALNDPNARQTALITGEIDAVSLVDLKTVGLLQRAPGVLIDDVASGAHITLPMFVDVAPFDDLNVRLALKHAINRQEIIDKILFGHGTIGNDHPIAPSLPFHADLEQRTYDPDKANFYLKEAGMDSLNVQLSSADSVFSGAVEMCVLFSEQARPTGINIEVVREPNDGYWSNVWLVKPFVFVAWGARPTPDVMFSLAYKADAAWNESHWQNERFNELLLLAKAELDEAKRAEMYAEMQLLCRDDGGTIVPVFNNRVMARRDNVMHEDSIASNWELDGARAYQRWWFA
ncbi:peptide ABC transporter substrate-binding protein [Rhodobacteraceae bacterium 2CG4]|uniref:Peptide ABC transporter substrate-binding protein n=1 Tax=Halovulum marinum TaxID=2662447 RepID=A0A6L5Z5Q9_9RHOB|nr:ABC transporter substrate-binding protein [Halovulum marinum]MSU91405.1 peptide ABC transporter substrate-binding protein [Halovulum marinum]